MSLGLFLFDDLFDIQDEFDGLIGSCNTVSTNFEPFNTPSMDLYETENSYKIIMDLPGINKHDLRIESDAESLEIRLSDETKIEKIKSFLHLKEKSQGLLIRKIIFPGYITPSKASINLEDGLLTIIVPKAEVSSKISLKIE